jgi:site-specific recombinase XerD
LNRAPAKVVQELAGHADLTTTMRYMHLAEGSNEAAIAVLDQPAASLEKAEATE